MRSSPLEKRFADTPKGRIAFLEGGEPTAPCVLLLHGIPTSSYLWRDVIPLLAPHFRCLAPDLMGLGDTVVDPDRTDFGMLSQAEMLDDFLDAVGAGSVHVVAHDQGGAAGQLFAVNRTRRVRSLVLTDCVAYDNWPVPAIARLQLAARLAPRTVRALGRAGLMRWWQQRYPRSSFRLGVSHSGRLPRASIAEYLRPLEGNERQRAGFLAFLLAGTPKPTLDIVPRLRALQIPTLILWATGDRYIPLSWARRLYADIPGAVALRLLDGAGHFWQEENPAPFVREIDVRTVGAWMCGWDWHDHGNIEEDLNYFVSLRPTYQQLTRVSPFPGTPLWDRLREEGRVRDVPWEDVHFWSGAQQNTSLESHETLNLVDRGCRLMYETWGPSVMRRLDVELDGYAHCIQSDNPLLRKHKAKFFKRQCAMLWWLLPACERFAPNGAVRRRIRKIDEKYRTWIGEPTPMMTTVASALDKVAVAARVKELVDPQNRYVKEEPFKRYLYRSGAASAADEPFTLPYEPQCPGQADLDYRVGMLRAQALWTAVRLACEVARKASPKRADPVIDDYLMDRIRNERFGIGF